MSEPTSDDNRFIDEINEHSITLIGFMPATEQQIVESRVAQDNDEVCSQIKQ